jgi:vanillate monooxygenase ferredoxin subunit
MAGMTTVTGTNGAADGIGGYTSADGWFSARIVGKAQETESIYVYTLAEPAGKELPAFAAGAHLEVRLGDLIRHYSLCNSPAERMRYQIAVKREADGRGGSRALCDGFQIGDALTIRGPRHAFRLASDRGTSLLVAGGIGITPLMSMIEHLALGDREFELHYLTRSRVQTAFLDRLAKAAFANAVHFHFDDGAVEQRAVFAEILANKDPDRHLYVCGPGPMIDHVTGAAEQAGWAAANIHSERFSADASASTKSKEGFRIKVRSTGQVIFVAPEKSVIQALREEARIHVPVSCEEGVCGTCLIGLLEGIPDHRDSILSADEQHANKLFLPCCSRAISEMLVLDL